MDHDEEEADLWATLPDYSELFEQWELGPFRLRDGFDYSADFREWQNIREANLIRYQLTILLGKDDLEKCLEGAIETARCAVEHSQLEAHAAWFKSEAWLPSLDDLTDADREHADIVMQSLDMVGPPDGQSEQAIMAAVGLWCVGEYHHFKHSGDMVRAAWALGQAGIALGESQLYKGLANATAQQRAANKEKVAKALAVRHQANRQRQEAARAWFADEGSKLRKAEAARQISDRFHVVEDVAKRWVRKFTVGDSTSESRDRAT